MARPDSCLDIRRSHESKANWGLQNRYEVLYELRTSYEYGRTSPAKNHHHHHHRLEEESVERRKDGQALSLPTKKIERKNITPPIVTRDLYNLFWTTMEQESREE